MSAIAAILAREAPLAPSDISDIMSAMTGRGAASLSVWQNGSAALGHAGLFAPSLDFDQQPAVDPASGCALVLDGRIDARADLAASRQISDGAVDRMNDAELVLRAYLARGTDVFATMLGDFAFALWDGPGARLVCGRDVLGLRPLFYTSTADDLVVASELQAVLRGRPGTANLGMVAEALTCMPTSRHETLFENVFRIPPGHLLVADRSGTRVERFVQLTAPAPLAQRDPREYVEQFRALFTAAVRDRLPAARMAGVMLSGGVDSSTIYAAARTMSPVDAYTVGHDDPLLDETPIARAVVERNGGRLHRADVSASTYDYTEEVLRFRDLPTYPTGANGAGLRRLAASHGVTVLLNGLGGDECFLGHSGRWTDWLVHGEWLLLWRELRTWNRSADAVPWPALARMTIQPLVPPRLRRAAAALIHRGDPFPWVPEAFLQHTAFADRVRRVPDERGATYAVTGMIHSLIDGAAIAAWEEQERLATRFRQEDRMPFLDRRVIAFALALPETLRSTPGSPKDFVRRAWSDRLPASVMNPLDARDYAIHVVDALEAYGGAACFDDLAIADLGWIDTAVVRRMAVQLFTTARTSREYMAHAARLWAVFAVDAWYRRALDLSLCPKKNQNRSSQNGPMPLTSASIGGRR
jgi:asparagine synthase (glutamine-hydrolysing)